MNKLVIVESPNKIKSIEKYLGEGYKVMASVGHIVKLPSSGPHAFGVDLETWEPNYKIDPKKKTVVAKLKKAAKEAEIVLIASDPDREGEAIADNLVEFLNLEKYERIRFNEITKEAVGLAVNDPQKIDYALVNSQKARRILDRIIGYKLSTLMRKKIPGAPLAPSAGRVQSIALKLVVDRELLIRAFVPVHYFKAEAVINSEVSAQFYNPKNKEHKDWILPEEVEAVEKTFSGSLTVSAIKVSKRKDKKLLPLKQAALYRKADSSLGISSKSVQYAAQRLYEGYGDGGLISYPRTDSTRLSNSFVTNAKKFIEKKFGKDYIASDIKGVAGSQDAHEAIRPTDPNLTPEQAKTKFNLESNEYKVYRLIYNHTLQALMNVPEREILRYELMDGDNHFKMSASKVTYDGYLKLTGYETSKELPKYSEGEVVKVKKYDVQAHETKPPARYNDGSLIEKLDSIGVGRPSTFATTINILKVRTYVEMEGKAMKATEFGEIVIGKLLEAFPKIITEEYTANMETQLDDISDGNADYKKLLGDFWKEFEAKIETATESLEATKMMPILANKKCPLCGEELIVRRNKRDHTKFFGCSAFPKCRHAESDPTQKKVFRKFYKKK
ncbi:MAG: type I DNA topoisomerase [Mycoplasmataceae bacterium]|nr:type I DNA topoisomerase [Mycoplasmataceae bacterium]